MEVKLNSAPRETRSGYAECELACAPQASFTAGLPVFHRQAVSLPVLQREGVFRILATVNVSTRDICNRLRVEATLWLPLAHLLSACICAHTQIGERRLIASWKRHVVPCEISRNVYGSKIST